MAELSDEIEQKSHTYIAVFQNLIYFNLLEGNQPIFLLKIPYT